MNSLEQKAVKSVFWVGVAKAFGQVITWSVTFVLIRLLSPDAYGLMGMALVYKFFVTIFFDMSIGEAVLQKKDLKEVDIHTAFWICLTFAIALYGITWPSAIAFAHFFNSPDLVKIIRVIGLSLIPLSIKEIPNRLMARDFEFKKRSFCEMIASIVNVIICLLMALKGYGVWSLVIGEVAGVIILSFLIVFYKRWLPKFQFSFSSARELLSYGLPVTGHYLLTYFSSRLDVILIGRLLGQTILGYYSVAISLSRMPVNKGVFLIQGVVFPLFSTLQDNLVELKKYYYMVIHLISIFIFPVFLGMFAVAEEIIVVILSPKWLPSLFPFKVFCLLGILLSFRGILLVILKARGKTRPVFMFSIYSVIFLPLSFIALSRYGLAGMAMSWIIVYPFLFGFIFYHVIQDIQASYVETFKRIRAALIGSILIVLSVLILKTFVFQGAMNILSLVTYIVTGMIVYVAYFYFFSRQTFQDVRRIWKTLKSK